MIACLFENQHLSPEATSHVIEYAQLQMSRLNTGGWIPSIASMGFFHPTPVAHLTYPEPQDPKHSSSADAIELGTAPK